MELLNSGNAYKEVLQYIRQHKGYQWKAIMPINKGRYHIIVGTENILIIFKRDVFYSFGILDELKNQGAEGVGETINLDELKTAIGYDVKTIYIVYENGAIYSIDFWEFMRKSIRWTNGAEQKAVRSIGIKALARVNKVMENVTPTTI